uniref:BCL2L1 n=1 Tax=Paracentrotus lividus TaxID=7656 RepID=A0AAU7NI91_PARLI
MPDISTASIVADYLRYRVQSLGNCVDDDAAVEEIDDGEIIPRDLHEAIVNLSEKLMNDYRDSFNDMPNQLKINEQTVGATFKAVTSELFVDGGISWGRIVAFFSFGGALVEWCHEKNLPRAVRTVQELMIAYINSHLIAWIASNGGWDGLVDFSRHISLDDQALANGEWSGKQLVGVATLGILTVGAFFFRS